MYKLILFAIFVPVLVSAELLLTPCPKGDLPIAVQSDMCDKLPCQVKNGQNMRFEIKFKVPEDTSVVTVHAVAKLSFITYTYNIPPEHRNGCLWLKNATCPLKKGDIGTYHMDMPLASPLDNIKPTVQITLKGDKEVPLVCGGAAINISKP